MQFLIMWDIFSIFLYLKYVNRDLKIWVYKTIGSFFFGGGLAGGANQVILKCKKIA